MARSIWQGHLSFGLVTIPVDLFTASKDKDFDFSMLDGRDHAPIGYKKYNKTTGEEVPSDVIVKGYEYEKGEYVILTEDDLKSANVEATHTVDIVGFLDADAIPPQYFVKPYYVVPSKQSARPYALLRETMRRTGRVGLARVVIRTRQHLAALYVQGDVIVLELLRYGDEVLSSEAFTLPGGDLDALGVTERELDMATKLVEGLASDWDPDAYKDDYHDDLLALIEKKAKHGDTAVKVKVPDEAGGGEVIDIMELLKKSLAQASSKPSKATRTRPKAAHKPAKTRKAGRRG